MLVSKRKCSTNPSNFNSIPDRRKVRELEVRKGSKCSHLNPKLNLVAEFRAGNGPNGGMNGEYIKNCYQF